MTITHACAQVQQEVLRNVSCVAFPQATRRQPCARCGELRNLKNARHLCSHCWSWLDRIGQLERYPNVAWLRREQRIVRALYRVALGETNADKLAAYLGLTKAGMKDFFKRAAAAGDRRAAVVLDCLAPPCPVRASEPVRLSLKAQLREDRLEDAVDLVDMGETSRLAIAERLGVSEAAFERCLYRWRNAGDERAAIVLAKTSPLASLRRSA